MESSLENSATYRMICRPCGRWFRYSTGWITLDPNRLRSTGTLAATGSGVHKAASAWAKLAVLLVGSLISGCEAPTVTQRTPVGKTVRIVAANHYSMIIETTEGSFMVDGNRSCLKGKNASIVTNSYGERYLDVEGNPYGFVLIER